MVDPISLIVAALAAGAVAGAKDVAGAAIKDTYTALKDLIKRKFAGNKKAEETLDDHEKDPDVYEKPMRKVLQQSGADQDQQIIQVAEQLLQQLRSQGSSAGKYNPVFQGPVGRVAMGDYQQVDMREVHGSEGASDKDK